MCVCRSLQRKVSSADTACLPSPYAFSARVTTRHLQCVRNGRKVFSAGARTRVVFGCLCLVSETAMQPVRVLSSETVLDSLFSMSTNVWFFFHPVFLGPQRVRWIFCLKRFSSFLACCHPVLTSVVGCRTSGCPARCFLLFLLHF